MLTYFIFNIVAFLVIQDLENKLELRPLPTLTLETFVHLPSLLNINQDISETSMIISEVSCWLMMSYIEGQMYRKKGLPIIPIWLDSDEVNHDDSIGCQKIIGLICWLSGNNRLFVCSIVRICMYVCLCSIYVVVWFYPYYNTHSFFSQICVNQSPKFQYNTIACFIFLPRDGTTV